MESRGVDNPFGVSGLSSCEVAERIEAGKVNVNTELKTKSVKELVVENVCTLFNLINVVLAVLVLMTGAWKNLTFLGIVLLNTGIGIVQALRSKRMVDRLTLLASKKAVAIRDGVMVDLDLDQIVLDDVIRLGRGDQIPADAVVVEGECHVNESLLTGESNPIHKRPGDELMSGSFIDAGLVVARVIHVGADNYVARISNEAKYVKKVNSEIMSALNAIVRFASVLMVPLGIALFISSVHGSYVAARHAGPDALEWLLSSPDSQSTISNAILTTVGALLGMIPQGLVLLTSSVLAIATIRLARRKVLVQQLYCIETLARVDVLCLDKTGTITSGHMKVEDIYAVMPDGSIAPVEPNGAGPDGIEPAELLSAVAGIAHATSADANETCTALLGYFSDRADIPGFTRTIPFSSAKKWSGATLVGEGDQARERSYVMGAAQFVLSPSDFTRFEARVNELASTCRVLVAAQVDGFTDEGDMIGRARPLGFVSIRDEIRPSAIDTVRYFCDQGVTLNVISGDDPRTVSSIARVVGIPGADSFVDATTLDTPSKLDAAVGRYHVFGRVTPQQKRELVVALQRRGHTVAMTGDGVNDVLAFKEADCSVAMAAGSDAARNVAELVLVENDFAAMPAVVAEGRRSINNLQRSAALFLTKTLLSMGLAAICIAAPPYPFQPITMTLINFFCIGFPSFVLALEPNNARVSGSFLANVLKRSLSAAVGVLATSLLGILSAGIFGFGQQMLSTMCLISTCSVGVCLIWRISVPFTPLRRAVLAFVMAGLSAGIIMVPAFFSIARLTIGPFALTMAFSVLGCLLFYRLADFMERSPERCGRLATGFGRGVRVSLRAKGRSGRPCVSSTGGVLDRVIRAVRSHVDARAGSQKSDRSAQAGGVPPSGLSGDDVRRGVVNAQVDRRAVRKKRYRVEQANDGIRLKMPRTSRKKDQ